MTPRGEWFKAEETETLSGLAKCLAGAGRHADCTLRSATADSVTPNLPGHSPKVHHKFFGEPPHFGAYSHLSTFVETGLSVKIIFNTRLLHH